LRVDVHDNVRLIEGVNEPSKRLGSGKALLDERANEWLGRANVTRIRILRGEDRREHDDRDHHPPPIAVGASTGRWSNSEARQVGGGSGETTGVFRGFDVSARFGRFEVDSDRRQLLKHGVEKHLTPRAFDLLVLLIGAAPRVVRKEELHQRLWPGTFVSDATLVGLIKELRRALEDRDARARLIRTAHGVGYAFAGPLDRSRPARSDVPRWVVVGARRVLLPEGDHLIGRDAAAAIVLDVAGVSRRHAQIVIAHREATLEDLGSKNGTTIANSAITGP